MTDILVIGGGIAGISAAARLSGHARVTLLEQESALGYHASGRSAALFEENYGKPSTVALNKASAAYHKTALGGVLSPRGLLLIGTKDSDAAFSADRATMKLNEIPLSEATSLWPILNTDVVTRAAYDAAAYDIDTDRLIQNFARELRANGGTVLTGQTVTAITRSASRWEVTTGAGRFHAAMLVNAAGAWADQIAGLAGVAPIGLAPLRRSMARVPAPDGQNVSAWPMIFGPGEDWYAKPDAGALLVSPAEEVPCAPHDAYADDMTLAEGLARFEAHVTYETKRLLSSWAGLRTFSPDRTLVIGPEPEAPTFVWCAGQGGYGIQSSPAASQLLADLALGHEPELDRATIAALHPRRFRA